MYDKLINSQYFDKHLNLYKKKKDSIKIVFKI